ncbi:glycosyltransferase family 4 protein [Pseudidiomarina donghaiensis]|uniref:Glycosyltransferase WbuB n=1 Tax=Pseudidiomarina donghaiensis TaxID=519452 RepID=A0A432XKW2_9GAMM|nr:glycosyltransferase family 4 protein [Pseudidiomarina donghaiensis]RUO49328.1 glycosyltransferase WbuB [Pseudidiomarina donghaiensis]SFV21000.1 Glycosyltransferase involved in cell wall bisynthesis [Pseudidiomarina donghaiensis]
MKSVWFINHYASTPSCGFGGRTYYFAKELRKRGYDTKLIISNPHHLLRSPLKQPTSVFEQDKDDVHLVSLKGLNYDSAHSVKRILNWFVFSYRLRGLVKKYKDNPPDYIFCSSPSIVSTSGARYLSRKLNAKLVIDIRDIWPLTLIELGGKSERHPLIRILRKYEIQAYKDAHLITSNLKGFSKYLVENGFTDSRFEWLPNGYDKNEYTESVKAIKSDEFIVGYAGTFGLANSLFPLLEAACLLQKHKEIKFVFVGEGREAERMKTFCTSHNLKNVEFQDFVPKAEIQKVLSSFDVLTVGARRSNLYKYGVSPNKLFDYFNASKPIIYYIDSPGFHPICDSQSGVEVPSGGAAEIAAAIVKIKDLSKAEREEMGKRGKDFAEKHFEYSALTDDLERMLKSL